MFFLLTAVQKLQKSNEFSRVMITNVLPRFYESQCIGLTYIPVVRLIQLSLMSDRHVG